MKRLSIIISLIVIVFMPCIADEYIIKAMNGQSIQIGLDHRICHVGSKFKSNEKIYWSESKVTLIEAQNIENMNICFFVPTGTLSKDNSKTSNVFQRFFNYFVNVTHLSTRESDVYDMEEALTEREFPLADTIRIKTNEIKDNRKYFASFYLNGKKQVVPLDSDNGNIIFARDKFIKDGITLPYKFILTIFYKEDEYYHEITNGMSITVFDIKNE